MLQTANSTIRERLKARLLCPLLLQLGVALPILTSVCGFSFAAGRDTDWTPINAGLPSAIQGVNALIPDPATPATVYAVTNNGTIFKSADSAASWHRINGVVGVISLAIDPETSSTLYAASATTIFKSSDGG